MKTKYDKLPFGNITNDRANANVRASKLKFNYNDLRAIYSTFYKEEVPAWKRFFYPFIEWIHDEAGVEGRDLLKEWKKLGTY